jgi:hypothetical protein
LRKLEGLVPLQSNFIEAKCINYRRQKRRQAKDLRNKKGNKKDEL